MVKVSHDRRTETLWYVQTKQNLLSNKNMQHQLGYARSS